MARVLGTTRTFSQTRSLQKDFGTCIYTTANNQDRVNLGNILLTNTSVTVAIWANFRSNSSSNYDVFFGYSTARWFLIRIGSGNRVSFNFKASGVEKATGYPAKSLLFGRWYLIVGTHDPNGGANNTTIRIYNQNGTLYDSLSKTNAFSIDSTGNGLFIGRDVNRNTSCDAKFDEARIYSRVLTTTEQDNLALNIDPDSTGLIGYWKFDEGSGTTAIDSSGSGNNGSLVGAAIAYSSNVVAKPRTASTGRHTE